MAQIQLMGGAKNGTLKPNISKETRIKSEFLLGWASHGYILRAHMNKCMVFSNVLNYRKMA